VQHHLARRGVLAPEHVSLACTDGDPYFEMQRPTIAHIRWDSRPWVRRVVQWADGVSQGKIDRRQSLTKAEFVEGGSVGRATGG
jgi:DNA-binding LacI/PurR family transcriptional regulator